MITIQHLIPLMGAFSIASDGLTGIEEKTTTFSLSNFKYNETELTNFKPDMHITYCDEEYPEILKDITNSFDMENINEFVKKFNVEPSSILTGVPPCGGLSLLNSTKNRGAEAEQNRFMLFCIKFYLATNSDVLVIENAPALCENIGKKLVAFIYQLIKVNGYARKVQLVRTTTLQHSLPQNRNRSFLLIHKNPTFIRLLNKPHEDCSLQQFLNSFENSPDDSMQVMPAMLFDGADWLLVLKDLGYPIFDKATSILKYLVNNDIHVNPKNKLVTRYVEHAKAKLAINKGYWDQSAIYPGRYATAVTSKNAFKVLYPGDSSRYLTLRDFARLMGLPESFNLLHKNTPNIICQSVPINTARDAIRWAIECFNNIDPIDIDTKVLLQNNIRGDLYNDLYTFDGNNYHPYMISRVIKSLNDIM